MRRSECRAWIWGASSKMGQKFVVFHSQSRACARYFFSLKMKLKKLFVVRENRRNLISGKVSFLFTMLDVDDRTVGWKLKCVLLIWCCNTGCFRVCGATNGNIGFNLFPPSITNASLGIFFPNWFPSVNRYFSAGNLENEFVWECIELGSYLDFHSCICLDRRREESSRGALEPTTYVICGYLFLINETSSVARFEITMTTGGKLIFFDSQRSLHWTLITRRKICGSSWIEIFMDGYLARLRNYFASSVEIIPQNGNKA